MAATKHAQSVQQDTKFFITTALLQLISNYKLSNVTISQVCKRAGVSRMAFYRNFNELDQVLYEYFQPKMSDVFITIRLNSNNDSKINKQLFFYNELNGFLLQSISNGYEFIIEKIFIEEFMKFYDGKTDEYWISFMSAGVYSLWRKWLLDGRQKPIGEIAEFLRKCNTIRI